jgi:hypothetical protein
VGENAARQHLADQFQGQIVQAIHLDSDKGVEAPGLLGFLFIPDVDFVPDPGIEGMLIDVLGVPVEELVESLSQLANGVLFGPALAG